MSTLCGPEELPKRCEPWVFLEWVDWFGLLADSSIALTQPVAESKVVRRSARGLVAAVVPMSFGAVAPQRRLSVGRPTIGRASGSGADSVRPSATRWIVFLRFEPPRV